MKLVHWPLMGWLLHLIQRRGDWAGPQPAKAPFRCTKCNSHPSTASVPITVLLYKGPLLCGFNVPVKELNSVGRSAVQRGARRAFLCLAPVVIFPLYPLISSNGVRWFVHSSRSTTEICSCNAIIIAKLKLNG